MLRPTFPGPMAFLGSLLLSLTPICASDDLSAMLETHLGEHPELPSIAAIAIVDGELRAAGAGGVRKKGDPTPVTLADKYHIGSCTKAFTAVLAADLVEDGVLSWDSRVGAVLADLRPEAPVREASLLQLVSNTSGLPGEVPPEIWSAAWEADGEPRRQRIGFARSMLRLETPAPGSRNEYSNAGFAVAGVMMEERTDTSWEDLVRRRIFIPLGMDSAGFYGPAEDPDSPDQPWGHRSDGSPVAPGRGADNPPAIAPAGAIHCSLPDLVPWLQFHLESRPGPILSEEASFEKLHTPMLGDYALGWMVLERPWAGGNALHHMGSNTMYTMVIWLAPERDFGVAVATNIGSDAGFAPCDALVGKLIGAYLR